MYLYSTSYLLTIVAFACIVSSIIITGLVCVYHANKQDFKEFRQVLILNGIMVGFGIFHFFSCLLPLLVKTFTYWR